MRVSVAARRVRWVLTFERHDGAQPLEHTRNTEERVALEQTKRRSTPACVLILLTFRQAGC